jgi:hypothetical protein
MKILNNKMQSWIKEWALKQQFITKRITFKVKNIEEIHNIVYNTFSLQLYPEVIERTTTNNFFMKLHRDDYHIDYYKFKKGIRDPSILWIPIYKKEERPIITVIWYRSTQGIDFNGGYLRFFDGEMISPIKDNAILFDSNDPHEVTTQNNLKNERKVIIIKYYKK